MARSGSQIRSLIPEFIMRIASRKLPRLRGLLKRLWNRLTVRVFQASEEMVTDSIM